RLLPLRAVGRRVATKEQGVEVRVLSAESQVTPAGGEQPSAGLVDAGTGSEQMVQELVESLRDDGPDNLLRPPETRVARLRGDGDPAGDRAQGHRFGRA